MKKLEDDDKPILSIRLKWIDRRDLTDIIDLDPDVAKNDRTAATRAALRYYAKYLRRRAKSVAA